MTFKIQKKEMPKTAGSKRGRKAKYPIGELKKGEAFFVKKDGKIYKSLLQSAINQYKKKHNETKRAYLVEEDKKGFWVYRTK